MADLQEVLASLDPADQAKIDQASTEWPHCLTQALQQLEGLRHHRSCVLKMQCSAPFNHLRLVLHCCCAK